MRGFSRQCLSSHANTACPSTSRSGSKPGSGASSVRSHVEYVAAPERNPRAHCPVCTHWFEDFLSSSHAPQLFPTPAPMACFVPCPRAGPATHRMRRQMAMRLISRGLRHFGFHSRASFCASATWSLVILEATRARSSAAAPLMARIASQGGGGWAAARFSHLCAWT